MPVRPFLSLVLLFVLSALTALSGAARAQGADPWARWHSAESPHFRVHYHDDQRPQAEAVAQAAERAFARISGALRWPPRSRIDLVVFSEFDLPNGFSTPLPSNLVGAFLTPPEGELIENSRWLDLLLTHEMVHSIHLDKAWGGPANLREIVGRFPLLFPNLFQPTWALEGLAVYFEGAQDGGPAAAARLGRGRLYGPDFESWLRARQSKGFPSLAEISANGRALPLSKAYLYGAYFYDFVARRHGAQAIPALVENYSGNFVPRFLSYTEPVTGLEMDALWAEFLRDLDQQVSARAEPLRRQPEVLGPALGAPTADISGVAALPAPPSIRPALVATLSDGLHDAELIRIEPDGSRRTLTSLLGQSPRLEVSATGDILVTQADLCQNSWLTLDAWRWNEREGRLDRLSRCAHLRRAAQAGSAVLAIQLDGGRTRLVRLGNTAQAPVTVLHDPGPGTDLLDLAVSADGRHVLLVQHAAPDWQLIELSLDALATSVSDPQLRLVSNAPIQAPHYGAAGIIELLLARDGTTEVWRLREAPSPALERLTHSHTGVSGHSGSATDGSLAVVTFDADGRQLHRLEAPVALETLALDSARRLNLDGAGSARAPQPRPEVAAASLPPAPEPEAAASRLGTGSPYNAWGTMAPRYWWPVAIADHGLTSYGFSTSGADALRLHQYALDLEVETSQHQGLGSLEYLWGPYVHLALQRRAVALAWQPVNGQEQTLLYERHTQAQGLLMLPSLTLSRRVVLGVGTAIDRIEDLPTPAASPLMGPFGMPALTVQNDRVVDLLLDLDTRRAHWWSEGPNQGLRLLLLGESYAPWRDTVSGYDGHLLRADLNALFDLSRLGRSVLALRHTEVRSTGSIRPFQLGGATDPQLQLGYSLNNRQIALRGYVGTEAALRGPNARVSSVEWRFPLADVDAQGLSPPIGLNRLSGSVFYDIGGVWSPAPGPTYGNGSPAQLYRGAGIELLGEVRLLHALGVQLRLGLARAIGQDGGTAYLTAGRSF